MKGDTMTEILLKWAIPFILGAAVSGIATYIKMLRRRERAIHEGVQCLLRAEIIACHERYSALMYCPIYAKESHKRMYHSYHNLGGNDVATSLYEKLLAMPESLHEGEYEL